MKFRTQSLLYQKIKKEAVNTLLAHEYVKNVKMIAVRDGAFNLTVEHQGVEDSVEKIFQVRFFFSELEEDKAFELRVSGAFNYSSLFKEKSSEELQALQANLFQLVYTHFLDPIVQKKNYRFVFIQIEDSSSLKDFFAQEGFVSENSLNFYERKLYEIEEESLSSSLLAKIYRKDCRADTMKRVDFIRDVVAYVNKRSSGKEDTFSALSPTFDAQTNVFQLRFYYQGVFGEFALTILDDGHQLVLKHEPSNKLLHSFDEFKWFLIQQLDEIEQKQRLKNLFNPPSYHFDLMFDAELKFFLPKKLIYEGLLTHYTPEDIEKKAKDEEFGTYSSIKTSDSRQRILYMELFDVYFVINQKGKDSSTFTFHREREQKEKVISLYEDLFFQAHETEKKELFASFGSPEEMKNKLLANR